MAESDKNKSAVDEYKSPARKLIPFFKSSRDKWKAKCLAAKYQIKLLRNRLRHMERRGADLKHKLKALEKELQSVKNKKQKLAHEVERLKKTADAGERPRRG
jgi:chromosome segregation ATPase